MDGVVIYGIGSPLAVDAEESCARLALVVRAAIRNVDGPTYVSEALAVVDAAAAGPELTRCEVVLPLFTPANRLAALEDARRHGFTRTATLVDPTSILASSTTVGEGVYVNAGCTIGGAATLGDLALVNRGASLGHHVVLSELASVGPGAVLAGNVTLGRGAVVGAGAVVLPAVTIGDNAVVGAGAVVTKPVAANTLVLGNPARVVETAIAGFNGAGV